jgi:hypothetical protein
MSRFAQGFYKIKNLEKYVGKGMPKYRSGWEHAFMKFLDENEHVLQWASESLSIPYRNPITGKQSIYIPDFLITYRSKTSTMVAEIIEIKPKKQSVLESKLSARDAAIVAVNYAKWDAATKWAKRNGLSFRVITEDNLFRNGKK